MKNWRLIQKQNFRSIDKLATFLDWDEEILQLVSQHPFPLNLPIRLAKKIPKNCKEHPLFHQFIPTKKEYIHDPQFSLDPVQDKDFQLTPRLLKKYSGRALLLTTGACAMHCRFCFRQNYPYKNFAFSEEMQILKKDTSIYEVILSGGDPLSLTDENLNELMNQLEEIPHIKIIRFHTRFIVGIPERISQEFLKIISNRSIQIIFILHINHSLELDEDVTLAIRKLQQCKVAVLSHTVLLKDVNDDIQQLKKLFLSLSSIGVIPYYLFELDRVQGTKHFEVSRSKGLKLIEQLQIILPGYAIPKYTVEIPHKHSKTVLTSEAMSSSPKLKVL